MNYIKEIREARGFTQKKLADELKLSVSTITKWETQKSAPRAKILPMVAKVLGCSIDDLFTKQKGA